MPKKIICFDLDGTLTPYSTWEAFNKRLGITEEDDQRLFTLYKEGNLEYQDWITELVRLYKKNSAVIKKDIEAVAASIEVRSDAQQAIDDAKAKGYHVIILSGGIDVIVATMAHRLGIAEWFTPNKAVFNDSDELINIEESGHERDALVVLLKEFCLKNNYKVSEVITVADGGNDTELFKTTKGVLLGDNKELLSLAWKHIETLSELNSLL